jgi:uncharacterized protein YjiS (DUF1127 family)
MRMSHVKPDKLSFVSFRPVVQSANSTNTLLRLAVTIAVHHSLTNCRTTHHPSIAWATLTKLFGRLIRLWRSRIRERRAFVSFDDRDLHDIGVSRWDLERELARPFWKG